MLIFLFILFICKELVYYKLDKAKSIQETQFYRGLHQQINVYLSRQSCLGYGELRKLV